MDPGGCGEQGDDPPGLRSGLLSFPLLGCLTMRRRCVVVMGMPFANPSDPELQVCLGVWGGSCLLLCWSSRWKERRAEGGGLADCGPCITVAPCMRCTSSLRPASRGRGTPATLLCTRIPPGAHGIPGCKGTARRWHPDRPAGAHHRPAMHACICTPPDPDVDRLGTCCSSSPPSFSHSNPARVQPAHVLACSCTRTCA